MSSPETPAIDYYSIYDVDVKEETCEKVELASHADGDLLKFLKKWLLKLGLVAPKDKHHLF